MAVNWLTDILGETWASIRDIVKVKTDNLAKMDFTGDTNLPDGTIRWNSVSSTFEKWNSGLGSWGPLAATYGINVDKVDGLDASAFAAASHVGAGGGAHAGASSGSAGFMSAADKIKIDAATSGVTPSTIVMRDASGHVSAVAGAIGAHVPQAQEVVGKTGAQSMAGPLTVTGTVTAAPDSLIKNQGAGLPDRGGRLLLEKPVNGTLASNIAVEVGADGVPNRARIGETGGTNRGVFFDLSKAGAGVTSDANFIVAESLGTNGWRKFSDGTIEQWGVAALPASGFGAVNFNLAHTTSVHSVVLTRFHTAQPGTAQGNPTVLNPIGLTSFSAYSGDTEVINYFWNSRGV